MEIKGFSKLIELLKDEHKKYALMRAKMQYLTGFCVAPFEPDIEVYINSNKYSEDQIKEIEDFLINQNIYVIKLADKYVERTKSNNTLIQIDKPRLHLGFENINAIQIENIIRIYPLLEISSDVEF